MSPTIYNALLKAKENGSKKMAVLIDPDRIKQHSIDHVLELAKTANVDYFFLGGSLVVSDMMSACIQSIRSQTDIPVILFPGDISQINHNADALLFLSLISGRNPDLLIGKHIVAAPLLKDSPLEVISTGYMLFDGGNITTAIYMSGSLPIPVSKVDIAVCTAMAGEMLGLKLIYMDAGSGAQQPIPEGLISAVSKKIDVPLIVGGGIRTPEKALANVQAGADIIVVGNAFEKDPTLMIEISDAVHSMARV